MKCLIKTDNSTNLPEVKYTQIVYNTDDNSMRIENKPVNIYYTCTEDSPIWLNYGKKNEDGLFLEDMFFPRLEDEDKVVEGVQYYAYDGTDYEDYNFYLTINDKGEHEEYVYYYNEDNNAMELYDEELLPFTICKYDPNVNIEETEVQLLASQTKKTVYQKVLTINGFNGFTEETNEYLTSIVIPKSVTRIGEWCIL